MPIHCLATSCAAASGTRTSVRVRRPETKKARSTDTSVAAGRIAFFA
ncbi:hypothetical protein NYE24_12030 [Paenibacillus sp. FSL H7-0350]